MLGSIVSLWRYPVKSMLGEELDAAEVTEAGLRGDRAYALVDRSDGKVASAKNPRKWPTLFAFHAATASADGVRITLPDGAVTGSGQPGVNRILSQAVQREVTLEPRGLREAAAEEYWPDIEGLDHRDTVTDFGLPPGTFFDAAVVHLLTTATLDRLHSLYPEGRFDIRRFRPNVVVDTGPAEPDLIGRVLAIGDAVRLSISAPCFRCVMTTLPQGGLPRDIGILRTAARHNGAKVGVYASVLRGGTVRRGDTVKLE